MRKYKLIVSLFALLNACVDPYQDNIAPAYDNYPVSTLMEIDSTYTQWVALLKYTDLFNTMNLSANYTCFVASDAAMYNYFNEKGISTVNDIPIAEAIYLVKYHTIPGKEYIQSIFDNGVLPDTTATGDYLSIEIRDGGLNSIFVNSEARIEKLDINATNGVIHVLDKVLTPVTETIWQKLAAPNYSIFKEAVELSAYAENLNTISQTETNTITGITKLSKKYYTLFAVTNEVYNSFGIYNVSDLQNYIKENSEDETDGINALNLYVAYHILNQSLDFGSLATFPENVYSRNMQTLAANRLINFSADGENLYLNKAKAGNTFTNIVNRNINAKNGVIHNVSTPLTIMQPPVTTVTWELTDYSELASRFANIYRKSTVTTTVGGYFTPGDVSCYVWDAIPASNNDNSVAYIVANKNDAVLFEMVNYDCLMLDLGLYGWIEMESPAIIKGTYNMSVSFYSIASNIESGKFLNILDGNYVGSEITTHGLSTTKTQIVSKMISEVTFDETKTHKLRILAGDDRQVFIDYIRFEPVITPEPIDTIAVEPVN